jgi:hypothetical protein
MDAIMVASDRLSKHAHFTATTSNLMSPGLVKLYLHNVWHHHGLPDRMISD